MEIHYSARFKIYMARTFKCRVKCCDCKLGSCLLTTILVGHSWFEQFRLSLPYIIKQLFVKVSQLIAFQS